MLTRFGTLYVGQVDHHHLGFDTPPVNERWYDDDHLVWHRNAGRYCG